MGCGKSRVGRELARLLCCPFMDLDQVIEEAQGRSIPEIFASDGEAAFRQMEVEALHNIVVHPVDSVGPLPASWVPTGPAAAGCSLQKSAGLFARSLTTPSRGWQNANSIHQAYTPLLPDGQCNAVMALGGGTVMTKECAEMVREQTTCIYLRTGVETLIERLSDEADGRPVLGCTSSPAPAGMSLRGAERRGNLRARIEELMALRSGTYEHTANMIVDTDGKTIEEVAGEIHGILMKKC